MTKHEHKHSDSHDHRHPHDNAGWKPHRDWRVLVVVLMLFAMIVYVLTLDESIQPGGAGALVPATPGPAAPAPAP